MSQNGSGHNANLQHFVTELREIEEEARADAFTTYLQQLGMLADAPPPKAASKSRARA